MIYLLQELGCKNEKCLLCWLIVSQDHGVATPGKSKLCSGKNVLLSPIPFQVLLSLLFAASLLYSQQHTKANKVV